MSTETHQSTIDSDEARISEAMSGSTEAFAGLVRAHHAAVRWHLSRSLRDPETVDDLAQEVFFYAYQNLCKFRGEGSFRSWLIGIARNRAKQHIRTEFRRRNRETNSLSLQLCLWRQERLEAQDSELEYELTVQSLRECIDALTSKSRRLIDEHYFQHRSLESLAKEWGQSGGAIRMMLFRIRKALGKCIQEKHPREV